MRKSHRDEEEKKVLKLYREYKETWSSRRDHGTWVEVEPYQKGWVRFYVVRDDVKGRNDIGRIRRCLDLINTQVYCGRGDFTETVWGKKRKSKERKPIEQPLRYLSEREYNQLSPDIAKYFQKQTWTRLERWPHKHYVTITGYVFTTPYWFVFHIEPNIITHHFLPDGEWESHVAEIKNKMYTHNLWPKINKALSKTTNNGHGPLSDVKGVYAKNKYGTLLTKEDLEYGDDS